MTSEERVSGKRIQLALTDFQRLIAGEDEMTYAFARYFARSLGSIDQELLPEGFMLVGVESLLHFMEEMNPKDTIPPGLTYVHLESKIPLMAEVLIYEGIFSEDYADKVHQFYERAVKSRSPPTCELGSPGED